MTVHVNSHHENTRHLIGAAWRKQIGNHIRAEHLTDFSAAHDQARRLQNPMLGVRRPYAHIFLINHLESGRCPSLHEPARLVLCLGKWWYSPLYMDLEFHAQIRTGRYDPRELQAWIDQGVLQPFVCRGEGCEKKFGLMSSLVLHCESRACGWDIARLNMPGLEKEVKQTCMRRDSGYVSR
jgi:hypothetical protein